MITAVCILLVGIKNIKNPIQIISLSDSSSSYCSSYYYRTARSSSSSLWNCLICFSYKPRVRNRLISIRIACIWVLYGLNDHRGMYSSGMHKKYIGSVVIHLDTYMSISSIFRVASMRSIYWYPSASIVYLVVKCSCGLFYSLVVSVAMCSISPVCLFFIRYTDSVG